MKPEEVIRIAVCCREWPVSPIFPIGRCKLCGVRPVIVR